MTVLPILLLILILLHRRRVTGRRVRTGQSTTSGARGNPMIRTPSDEELICGWMEPNPEVAPASWGDNPVGNINGWWIATGNGRIEHRSLTLDALWEVEERLTGEQWHDYVDLLAGFMWWRMVEHSNLQALLHSTPEQKIKALAAVIRGTII